MARGRAVRDGVKEARWRRIVRGQPGSGLSIRAYCRQHGLKDSAFYWWRTVLARRDAQRLPAAFVPVTVTADESARAGDGRIEIVLAGARRVQVVGRVNRQALADVVAVLEERPC